MATLVRPELSAKNKYWIDKHRYYELKHFCLQYPEWKKTYLELESASIPLSVIEHIPSSNLPTDPTTKRVLMKFFYSERIKLIEQAAKDADVYLYSYILKGVTEEKSYTYLKEKLGIPCSKDTYYDRYRRFFWVLDKSRD
jgi:hypothetical protein